MVRYAVNPGRLVWLLALSVTLVSCQAPVTGALAPRPLPSGDRVAVAPTGPTGPKFSQGLFGRITAPATLISNNAGGLISNNAGGLISNNAGGLISNHAGGLLGKGGGAYRLLGLEQVPLANTRVEVVDASGVAVRDASGKPLTAVTDATGEYRFDAQIPDKNLIVRAVLPGDRGQLQAVATKDRREQASDLDLISTFTTAYVLNKYVATQAEQQKVFDRYPGALEHETRAVALRAFNASGQTVPATLDTTASVTAVDALRKVDSGLDQQLEAVRKVLILAGQGDLGEGLMANTVALLDLYRLIEGPDGAIAFLSQDNGRVRVVTADGRLKTILERGVDSDERPYGARSLPGPVDHREFLFDAQGRAVLFIKNDLIRLEADGRVTHLLENVRDHRGLILDKQGRVVIIVERALLLLKDKGVTETLTEFQWPAGRGTPERFGYDGKEHVLLQYGDSEPLHTLSMRDGTTAVVVGATKGVMDARGTRIYTDDGYDGDLWVQRLDDDERLRIDVWSQSTLKQGHLMDAFLARDGGTIFAASSNGTILKIVDGRITRIAGVEPTQQQAGNAREVTLSEPAALALGKAGEMYLVDEGLKQFLKVDAAGKLSTLAFEQFYGNYTDVAGMRTDRQGRIYAFVNPNGQVSEGRPETNGSTYRTSGIYRLEEGKSPNLVVPIAGQHLVSFSVDADDRLVVLVNPSPVIAPGVTRQFRLLRVSPALGDDANFKSVPRQESWNQPAFITLDQRVEELASSTLNLDACELACAQDGSVIILGRQRLLVWHPVRGFETLATHRALNPPAVESRRLPGLAVSAAGRIAGVSGGWYDQDADATRDAGIWIWNPQTKALGRVAGAGTSQFAGSGVDDGLRDPCAPVFNAAGDLLFVDRGHRQVKRLAADKMTPVPMWSPSPSTGVAESGD